MVIRLSDILKEGQKELTPCPLFFDLSFRYGDTIKYFTDNINLLQCDLLDLKQKLIQSLPVKNTVVSVRYNRSRRDELFNWLMTIKLLPGKYTDESWIFKLENIPHGEIHFDTGQWTMKYLESEILERDDMDKEADDIEVYFEYYRSEIENKNQKKLLNYWAQEIYNLSPGNISLLNLLQSDDFFAQITDSQLKNKIELTLKQHGSDFGFLD